MRNVFVCYVWQHLINGMLTSNSSFLICRENCTHTHTHPHIETPTNHSKCNFNPFKMLNFQQHSLHTPDAEKKSVWERKGKKNTAQIHAYSRFHVMAYIYDAFSCILCQMPLKHMMTFEIAGAMWILASIICF